jgi:uncharacterized protein YkwD
MHPILVIGACVAGLSLASGNVAQDRKHHNTKTKWVTEIKTVQDGPPHAINYLWTGGWGPSERNHKHPHEGPHNDNDKPKKHHKKPHKGSNDHNNDDDDKPKKHRKHRKGSKGSGNDDKHKKPHKGSEADDDKHKKHHKKPHKGSKGHDSADDNNPKHYTNKAKGKHHKDENDEPNHDKAGRTKGSAPNDGDDDAKSALPGSHPAFYQPEVLECHNVHRANHSSPKIEWSDSLAATAGKIAKTCVYAHSMGVDGGHYGQNIAAGVTAAGISHIISDQFYNNEINAFGNQYGDPRPTGLEEWGHFSQLVWKNTDQVGCATQYCPNGLANTGSHVKPYFTVCNYSPPGNVAGRYAVNIGKPLGRPTVRGE